MSTDPNETEIASNRDTNVLTYNSNTTKFKDTVKRIKEKFALKLKPIKHILNTNKSKLILLQIVVYF